VKLKDQASFFSFFLEKPLYEVCLIRIKEQVGEKRSTVGAHRYADYLLKTRPPNIGNIIYPIELEIKDTTDTDRSASYLDLHLEIDSEGRLTTKLCCHL
jgi:hypothetical protein